MCQPVQVKNAHAVALGKLGGLKGGPARAAKLSPALRSSIARKAVTARWKKQREIERYGLGHLPPELRDQALQRIARCQKAKRLARTCGVDEGIAEHTLAALALPPLQRLIEGLTFERTLRQKRQLLWSAAKGASP
jgi:hypothetical protein